MANKTKNELLADIEALEKKLYDTQQNLIKYEQIAACADMGEEYKLIYDNYVNAGFTVIAAENNEGIVQIGAIKYPIRIDDITIDTDGTEFKATVLDPSVACYSKVDYKQYYAYTDGTEWIKNNPYIFSGRKNGKTLYIKQMINSIYGAPLTIEKVIFNPPATIVLWSDGTKTVVKAQDYDGYDPEKGLAMAICKKVMGNKGNYNNEINKWTDQYWEKIERIDCDCIFPSFINPDYGNELMSATENAKKLSEDLYKFTSNVFGTDK